MGPLKSFLNQRRSLELGKTGPPLANRPLGAKFALWSTHRDRETELSGRRLVLNFVMVVGWNA